MARASPLSVPSNELTYRQLAFWNFAGVPFSYCYSVLWMAGHAPSTYRFSGPTYVALFGSHLIAHYVFDTAMAQKSHFKMQMDGQTTIRRTFPQWPWNTIENPTYIQCENGGKLLTSGWWAYLRKPVSALALPCDQLTVVRITLRISCKCRDGRCVLAFRVPSCTGQCLPFRLHCTC
jgi:hypothetical protein